MANDYVVIDKNDKNTYKGGRGFQQKSILRKLGFPTAPYSLAGAKTLVRQAKQINSNLQLDVVPFKES